MAGHEDFLERRDFLKLLGPGLYFLFSVDDFLLGQQPRGSAGSYPEDFNAYLRIAEDGQVTCYSGKVELGQGIIASLAQMLAEELEVPLQVGFHGDGRHEAVPLGCRHKWFAEHQVFRSCAAGGGRRGAGSADSDGCRTSQSAGGSPDRQGWNRRRQRSDSAKKSPTDLSPKEKSLSGTFKRSPL